MNEENYLKKLRAVNITKWIPSFETNREDFAKEQGHTVLHGGSQMHIKLKDLRCFNIGNYFMIEIWMNYSHGSRSTMNHSVEDVFVPVPPRQDAHLEIGEFMTCPVSGKKAVERQDSGCTATTVTKNPLERRDSVVSNRSATKPGNVIKSANMDTDSLTKRSQFSDIFGGARDDVDNEAADGLLQNTAINMLPKFDQLMDDYVKRHSIRSSRKGTNLLFWLKSLGALFLVWLVIGNVLINNIMSGLLLGVSDLNNDGIRNFGTMHAVNAVRSLQILAGCQAGFTSDLCDLTLYDGFRFTNYTVQDWKNILQHSSGRFAGAVSGMFANLIHKKEDPEFFAAALELLQQPSMDLTLLRGQTEDISKRLNIIDALEYFSFSGDYIWRYPWSTTPAINVGTFTNATNDVANQGAKKLFTNRLPHLTRSMSYILENGVKIQRSLDETNLAYQDFFERTMSKAIVSFLILSIVPVGFLLFGISLYIIPNLKLLVDWQADILSTFMAIPKSLLQWWYVSLIRRLEEDTKEEEEGANAELYLYLQQNELLMTNMEDVKKKKGMSEGKALKDQEATKSVDPVTGKRTVSFRAALHAMKQKNIMSKLIFSSLLIVLIPLINLILLPKITQSASIGPQLNWFNRLTTNMQKVHYYSREAMFSKFDGDVTDNVQSFLTLANQSIELITLNHRYIIYGDPSRNLPGLGSDEFFSKILFGDACSAVTDDIAAYFVLPVACRDFQTNVLTFGLNNGLFLYEQRAMELVQGLASSRINITEAGQRIQYLESLLYQVASIVRGCRPQLSTPILTASSLNSNVLEPIQLLAAFIGTIYVYLRVYLPFMRTLQEDTNCMHSLLILFWSFASDCSTTAGDDEKKDAARLKEKEKALMEEKPSTSDLNLTQANVSITVGEKENARPIPAPSENSIATRAEPVIAPLTALSATFDSTANVIFYDTRNDENNDDDDDGAASDGTA